MSDEILKLVLLKVENMEHKMSNAQSLNGGFDKLLLEAQHIKEDYINETKPIIAQHQELILWKKEAKKDIDEVEDLRMDMAHFKEWKAGISKVIWLVATAAGGMWVKHFMDLMTK